jgi:hypothetical protein
MLLMAAFVVLPARYSGQRDIEALAASARNPDYY